MDLSEHARVNRAAWNVKAAEDVEQTKYEWVSPAWAHRWPVEEIRVARRSA
jgi:hypothetical protein